MTIRLFRTTARIGRRTKSAVNPRRRAAAVRPRRHQRRRRAGGAPCRPRVAGCASPSKRNGAPGAQHLHPLRHHHRARREVGVDQHRVVVALDDAHRHLLRLAARRRPRHRRRPRSTGSPADRPRRRCRRESAWRSRRPCRRAAGRRRCRGSPAPGACGCPALIAAVERHHLAGRASSSGRRQRPRRDRRARLRPGRRSAPARGSRRGCASGRRGSRPRSRSPTWSPTSTPRMPTQPSNGARITRRSSASSASRSASSAWSPRELRRRAAAPR